MRADEFLDATPILAADDFLDAPPEDYTNTGGGGGSMPQMDLTPDQTPMGSEMGFGEYLKTLGQSAAHLGMGALSFPASILAGAGGIIQGKGVQGAREAQERVGKFFTPNVGQLTPTAEEFLGTTGKILSAPREAAGELGARYGGETGRFVGETAADILMTLAPMAPRVVRNIGASKWWWDLNGGTKALVVQSLDDMIKRGYSEGEVLRRWSNPDYRAQALARRIKPENAPGAEPMVTPAPPPQTPQGRLMRPTGNKLPEPAFSVEDRMGLTAGAYPGRMAGENAPFSPELAEQLNQPPALPAGQGFELEGQPYSFKQPPPSFPPMQPGPGIVMDIAQGEGGQPGYVPSNIAPYEPTPIPESRFVFDDTPSADYSQIPERINGLKYRQTKQELLDQGYTPELADFLLRKQEDRANGFADVGSWGRTELLNPPAGSKRMESGDRITVYRAVPKGKDINIGDYVFTNKDDALEFVNTEGKKRGQPVIVEKEISANELIVPNENYPGEAIYAPTTPDLATTARPPVAEARVDTPRDQFMKKVKKARAKKEPETLTQWIKEKGGIWDDSAPGEVRQFGTKEARTVGLVSKKNGKTLDELAEQAQGEWLPEGATANDFTDLIRQEIRSLRERKPEIRPRRLGDISQYEKQIADQEANYLTEQQANIDDLQKQGFDYLGPKGKIAAGDLGQPGTKIIRNGEEFTSKGFDNEGNVILKDGETIKVDPFETVEAEAFKKSNPFKIIRERLDKEQNLRERFKKDNGEIPFKVKVYEGDGIDKYAIVHKSLRYPGKWQVSRFDDKGPWGDSTHNTYEEALKEVQMYGQADLNEAEFPAVKQSKPTPKWVMGERIPFGVDVIDPTEKRPRVKPAMKQGGLFDAPEPAPTPKKGGKKITVEQMTIPARGESPSNTQSFPGPQIAGFVQPGERGPSRTPTFPKSPLEGGIAPGSRAHLVKPTDDIGLTYGKMGENKPIESLPVKERQLGKREEGRFAPAVSADELERVKNLKELPAKKILSGGKLDFSPEPTAFTFDKLGADAKEMFQIPVRKADHQTVKDQFEYKAEIAKLKEGLPKGASKRIGQYMIGLDPKGRTMLKQQGMEVIDATKLTEAEKNVVRWWNKKAEDFFVQVNGVREAAGLEPMNKRENYITFLRDLDAYAEAGIPIDKPGMMQELVDNDALHLRTIPFGFAKSRTKAIYPIETDFFNIAKRYGNTAIRFKNMTPPIAKGRELIGSYDEWNPKAEQPQSWSLRDSHPETFKFLQGYLDAASGTEGHVMPPKIEKVLRSIRKNITGATLSGNTRSAIVQATSLKESAVELGPKHFAEGLKRWASGEGAEAVEKSNVLKGREMDVSVKEIMDAAGGKIPATGAMRIPAKAVEGLSKGKRIATKYGFLPLRMIDQQVARITWLGAEAKGRALGLEGDALINYADDITVETQSSGNPIEISPLQRTELGRMFTVFQNFTINRYQFVKQKILGIGTGKGVSWPKALGYLLTLEAVGTVFEDMLNTQSPDPSPVGTFIRKTSETGNPAKGAGYAARDVLESLPGMSGLRYGSGLGGAPIDYSRDVMGYFSDKPDWQKKALLELVSKGAGVPGTAQIAKTKRGMDRGKEWWEAMWLTEKRSHKEPSGAVRVRR